MASRFVEVKQLVESPAECFQGASEDVIAADADGGFPLPRVPAVQCYKNKERERPCVHFIHVAALNSVRACVIAMLPVLKPCGKNQWRQNM